MTKRKVLARIPQRFRRRWLPTPKFTAAELSGTAIPVVYVRL